MPVPPIVAHTLPASPDPPGSPDSAVAITAFYHVRGRIHPVRCVRDPSGTRPPCDPSQPRPAPDPGDDLVVDGAQQVGPLGGRRQASVVRAAAVARAEQDDLVALGDAVRLVGGPQVDHDLVHADPTDDGPSHAVDRDREPPRGPEQPRHPVGVARRAPARGPVGPGVVQLWP